MRSTAMRDVEVGQDADLAFEVLVIGFTGLALDAQAFHQLPRCGGEHDDAAGLVLLLAHDLGANPHHEQPGFPYDQMWVMPFPRVVTVCGWRTWVYQPISIIDEQICFISSLCVEMMTAAPCWASSHSIRITTLALS